MNWKYVEFGITTNLTKEDDNGHSILDRNGANRRYARKIYHAEQRLWRIYSYRLYFDSTGPDRRLEPSEKLKEN